MSQPTIDPHFDGGPPGRAGAALGPEGKVMVEDVVSALTGGDFASLDAEGLKTQMQRAAEEFDRRTAMAFGKALLDSLCEDPGNVRLLEALVVLGLAHPDVLDAHRISLSVEGRRLAVLLERSGDVDRARGILELLASRMPKERTIDHELAGILRRSGETDELVERYLRRANLAVEDGRPSEAIPWLQEVLLLDRTRRDVARMIRDLRYQEAERSARSKRRNRVLLLLMLVTAGATALVGYEVDARERFASLPTADMDDRGSLQVRLAGVEGMLEGTYWTGMWAARQEVTTLRDRIHELDVEQARVEQTRRQADAEQEEQAEAARLRGLRDSELGRFESALLQFEEALRLAGPDWSHRAQVEVDVAALRRWQEANGK